MASFIKKLESTVGLARFRHVNAIESLEEERLNELGYYTGFACPHGHLIRDSNEHWCYECAKKILSNVCGFDVNYLQSDYRIKYAKVWNQINVTFPDECWEINGSSGTTPKRVCLPSYRSLYSKQKSENVNIHKAIYQCAWGDVGSLLVTRLCGNKRCGNPLHLVSSFNRNFPPQTIAPCVTEFDTKKLKMIGQGEHRGLDVTKVILKDHKNPITNPEYVKNRPEYNE